MGPVRTSRVTISTAMKMIRKKGLTVKMSHRRTMWTMDSDRLKLLSNMNSLSVLIEALTTTATNL